MFKNYLLVALRNLRKHKGYSFINITGLAIGMAACILILLYVQDELSYDKFNEKIDRIYRVERTGNINGQEFQTSYMAHPYGPALKNDFPEVEQAVRLWNPDLMVRDHNLHFIEEKILFMDANVFEVFSFQLSEGAPPNALTEPNSIVLTEEMALKYLGDPNPIGKSLPIRWDQEVIDFRITGILEKIPSNSHFHTNFIASYTSLDALLGTERMGEWLSNSIRTYILLKPNVSPVDLEAKFPDFVDKYMGSTIRLIVGSEIDVNQLLQLRLRPLSDIHLRSGMGGELEPGGSIATVYAFSAIAVLTLIIACINFMNLATARSASRAKEVGLRKVVGAQRHRLIVQFIGESVVLALIALMLGLILVALLMAPFNAISAKEFSLGFLKSPLVLIELLVFAVLVGAFSGTYPAFYLSAFRPVAVLKKDSGAGRKSRSATLRIVLVVLQFCISITLIACTFIVNKQLQYVRHKELGFRKEQMVVIPIQDNRIPDKMDIIKERIKLHPAVQGVAATHRIPGEGLGDTVFRREGSSEDDIIDTHVCRVDYDLFPVMDIRILAGRNFSRDFGDDPENSVILNETSMKSFGWLSPEEAVGKRLMYPYNVAPIEYKYLDIVGIVKDFHFTSLHNEILPILFHTGSVWGYLNYVVVRTVGQDIPGTLDYLKNTWNEFSPDNPFDYYFLDENFDRQYRAEMRVQRIFTYFTGLTIFIACLGLFGLASFSAEQRTKEIGIRKVLGASTSGLTMLLSREFTKWVLVSNVVALPVAYYAMHKWLQNFAYRAEMGVWPFVFSAVLAFLIAILTVGYQALKAAMTNPAKTLKYE